MRAVMLYLVGVAALLEAIRLGMWYRAALLGQQRRNHQTLTAFGAPRIDDTTTTYRTHPRTEPMATLPLYTAWLVSSLHGVLLKSSTCFPHPWKRTDFVQPALVFANDMDRKSFLQRCDRFFMFCRVSGKDQFFPQHIRSRGVARSGIGFPLKSQVAYT